MDRITRARTFVEKNGRDVDRARFAYHFGGGSQRELLDALARYQNPDGGFGRGLEPDIQAPDSNPFAIALALRYCVEAGVPVDHPLLTRTLDYLERTQDEASGWRFSEAVYQHQMAPWFQGWEWPNVNPACTIAGHLRQLGTGSERLHGRVEALFMRLARPEDLLGDGFYAVLPYASFFLPESAHPQRELYLSGVLWWLIRQHVNGTLPDAEHFLEYVRSPDTYTGRLLPQGMVADELDRLEGEQQEDGGWPTPYAEHWRGTATVQSLLFLRAFGRVTSVTGDRVSALFSAADMIGGGGAHEESRS